LSAPFPNSQRQGRWIQALLLSLLAVGLNLLPIRIFFGFELLLGSSVAVLAILLFGEIGLLVAISASLITLKVWGYPWCALTMVGEQLWLLVYLHYFNKSDRQRTNGRIILADILFWVTAGIPLIFLMFGVVINLDPSSILALGIKQSVNGAINTTLGLSLYLGFRIAQSQGNPAKAVSIHGLTITTVMLSVIVPSLTIASIATGQVVEASQQGQLQRLMLIARGVVIATPKEQAWIAESLHDSGSLIEFERIGRINRQASFQSNPGLLKVLAQTHISKVDAFIQARGLKILVANHMSSLQRQLIDGYWKFELSNSSLGPESVLSATVGQDSVVVVEPARELIVQVQRKTTRIIGVLSWNLLFAALISEIIAQAIAVQFNFGDSEASEAGKVPANEQVDRLGRSLSSSLRQGFIFNLNHLVGLYDEKIRENADLRENLLSTMLKLKDAKQEIDGLSTVDPLTGCYNRHQLYRRLDFELQRSNRDRSELSCMCFEVDHYAQIRDHYGQVIAEQVLVELAADIQARSRATDCLCRSGEATFSLILPMCSGAAAEGLARSFRDEVQGRMLAVELQEISVTISIGISCLKAGDDDSESLINRTENALYRAKMEGRNRIVMI
jgi:diguanylate cyclase (GGDEF)-like protein